MSPYQLPKKKAFFETYFTGISIQIITVISGVLVARLLGPEGRGLLAGALLWPTIIASVCYLGTNYSIARISAQPDISLEVVTRRSLGLVTILSVGGLLLGYFALPILIPKIEVKTLKLAQIFLIFVPINIAVTLLQAIDLGSRNLRRYNIIRILLNPIYLVLILLLFISNKPSVLLVGSALILSNLFILLARLLLTDFSVKPLYSLKWFRKIITKSYIFFVTSTGSLLNSYADRILLLWLLTTQELGLYSVALVASSAHLTYSKSAGLIMFSRSASQTPENALLDTVRFFKIFFIISFFISAGMLLIIPWALPLLYGQAFSPAVKIAFFLLGANFLRSLYEPIDESFKAQGAPQIGFIAAIAGLIVFAIGGIILSGRAGVIGLASAVILGKLTSLSIMLAILRHKTNYSIVPGNEEFSMIFSEIRSFISKFKK